MFLGGDDLTQAWVNVVDVDTWLMTNALVSQCSQGRENNTKFLKLKGQTGNI